MSSFTIQARNKETGEICTVWCMDDYFGQHEYGYIVNGGNALGEETFYAQYVPDDPINNDSTVAVTEKKE